MAAGRKKKAAPSYTTAKPKAKAKPRKSIDSFVSGAGETKAKGLVSRVKGPAMRRLTVYVTPELHKRAKVHVAGLDLNLSEWVSALIERELG